MLIKQQEYKEKSVLQFADNKDQSDVSYLGIYYCNSDTINPCYELVN